MTKVQLPETMTLDKIEALRSAFGWFYDQELNNPFSDKSTGFKFNDVTQYVDYLNSDEVGIPLKTSAKHIGIILEQWYETLTQTPTPEYEHADQTKTPQYESQSQTTITEESNPEAFVEAQKREESARIAEQKAREDVQRGIERQQQIYEKRVLEELKNKKVVVVPTEPIPTTKFTDKDKEALFIASQGAKEDPSTSTEFFKGKITESLSQADIQYQESVTPAVVEKTAVSITENLRSLPDWKSPNDIPTEVPSMNPVSPVVAMTLLEDARLKGIITDDEARKKAVEMAQNFALSLESENIVNFAGTESVLGENIASSFYGPADGHVTQFEIAENQESQREEGVEIDVESMYDNGKKFNELWGKIRSGTTTTDEVVSTSLTYIPTYTTPAGTSVTTQTTSILVKTIPTTVGTIYGFRQGAIAAYWARNGTPLLGSGSNIAGQLSSGLRGQMVVSDIIDASALVWSKPVAFRFGNFAIGLQTGFETPSGVQIARAGIKFGDKATVLGFAKEGTKVTVSKLTGQAAPKVLTAASGVLSKVMAALGVWATPIGMAIGAAIGWLLGKIIEKIDWTRVKGWLKDNGPILLLGGGLLLGGPAWGIGLGLGGLALAGKFTALGIARGTWRFFRRIGTFFLITIGTPVIVTLLVLPPLIAFIMFVINSGAYLVPPKPVAESGFGPGGGGYYCTTVKEPSGITSSVNSPIATRALHIVEDLYQGFWCFWNRSPSNNPPPDGPPRADFPDDAVLYPLNYPDLFNYDLFKQSPNGDPTGGNDLFWCTWLVQKAYTENGVSIANTLWSPDMKLDFENRGKFVPASSVTSLNAVPGSVIFFDVDNEKDRIDHVGIIYTTNGDDVTYVQSNAGLKAEHLTLGSNGLQGKPGYIDVIGIGLP